MVTPNPRAARACGAAFVSLDSLAREALKHAGVLVAPDIVAQRALEEAVMEVLQPSDAAGTARAAQGTIDELLRAGLPVTPTALPVADRLIRVAERYRSILAARGLVAAAEVTRQAARSVPVRQKVHVRGYPRLGWSDLDFLDALADDGSKLILPWLEADLFEVNTEAAAHLAARGWDITQEGGQAVMTGEAACRVYAIGGTSAPRRVTAVAHADMEAEVRSVLAQVKALLHQGMEPKDLALVARRDDQYGPLVQAVAWEYEVPVKCFYRLSARATRLGVWLDLLFAVIQNNGSFEVTARFLAHPFTDGLASEVWREVRKNPPTDLAAWLPHAPHLAALEWGAQAPREVYQACLHSALEHFGVQDRAMLDPQSRLLLHRFTHSVAFLDEPRTTTRDGFLSELSNVLDLLMVPQDLTSQGVELHTPLSIFGTSYHTVFVLGLAEGVLPAAIQEDPNLPFKARRELREAGVRVELAAEAAQRERLSLWAALQTAREEVKLSYPQQAFGAFLVRSAAFAQLRVEPKQETDPPCASLEEARAALLHGEGVVDDVLSRARIARSVEARRESSSPCDEFDGVTGEVMDLSARVFSASQLVTIGQCPYRWYAERVLRLKEPEEAEANLSPTLRGRLYHKTLELAMKRVLHETDQRAAALGCLRDAFTEAEKAVGVTHLPGWQARRAEHFAQLERIVLSDSFLPEGSRVVAVEEKFQAVWRGLRVEGVVDRADRTPDGLNLIDYKTSSQKPKGAKTTVGKTTLDVQLPLYVEAAAPALFPGEPVQLAVYYSLTKAKPIAQAVLDSEELDALAARVRGHFADGSFPVEPDAQGNACTYCGYDSLCRKGPRLDRKASA